MQYINLKDVCSITMGQSPDSKTYNKAHNGYAFYQGNADFGDLSPVPTTWCTEPKKIADKNDILISVRAPIGDLNIADESCAIGRGLAAIKILNSKIIDKDYLYIFLERASSLLNSQGTGSTFKAINKGNLENLNIPLRDIETQKQISQSINIIKNAINIKKEQLLSLDDLVKSRFIEMFGDTLSNKSLHCKISDIATVTIGLTYKPQNVSEQGTIVLRSGNIQNAELYLEKDIVRVSNINIPENKYVKKNDILMCSRNGSARLVGKCCLIPSLSEVMSFGAFMTVIRTNYPYFLNSFFNSVYFTQQLTGTQTASVNQITTGMLNDYAVIEPKIEEENEFAEFVKQIDKSKFVYHSKYFL